MHSCLVLSYSHGKMNIKPTWTSFNLILKLCMYVLNIDLMSISIYFDGINHFTMCWKFHNFSRNLVKVGCVFHYVLEVPQFLWPLATTYISVLTERNYGGNNVSSLFYNIWQASYKTWFNNSLETKLTL